MLSRVQAGSTCSAPPMLASCAVRWSVGDRIMTAAAKRIQARVGDVFRVPFGAAQHAYGQVVGQTGPQNLVVVFRATHATVEDAMRSGIELAAIVFDAKFRNGDWPILTN